LLTGQTVAHLEHDALREILRLALADQPRQVPQDPRPEAVMNALKFGGRHSAE